jgi:ParB family chromosome partitioning protein
LPQDVLDHLKAGRLTAGHARALITTDDPSGLAQQIVAKGLSVRDVEKLVKTRSSGEAPTKAPASPTKDADTRALEADLSAALGMQVAIDHDEAKARGKISISYKDLEQLDDLIRVLNSA